MLPDQNQAELLTFLQTTPPPSNDPLPEELLTHLASLPAARWNHSWAHTPGRLPALPDRPDASSHYHQIEIPPEILVAREIPA